MYLLIIICIQFIGFYVLYSTSSRAVFMKRRWNHWLQRHLLFSKLSGSLMLFASLVMFMTELGVTVGFLFALISVMTISGFTILLLPLQKA